MVGPVVCRRIGDPCCSTYCGSARKREVFCAGCGSTGAGVGRSCFRRPGCFWSA